MKTKELSWLSACELAEKLQSRALGAEALVRAHLECIAEREPVVRAFSYRNDDALIEQARVLDRGPIRGPLHGIALGVKDIIATFDQPTEYGSVIYKGHRPAWDAACVALIREAGGLVAGKTVTTEFASSRPGGTTNPHNPAHTPGGSSSGSAAAVASGMLPLALGTQTGGSVIRPASFCGIVGYKPTFGLINRHGVKQLSESLDTVGILARTVRDAALLASVAAARSDLIDLPAVAYLRVGIWRTYEWGEAQPETVAALDRAARRLSEAGAFVGEAKMASSFAKADHAHHIIERFEMARSLAFEMNLHRDLLSPALRARIEEGRACSPQDYDEMRAAASACRQEMDDVFLRYDVLLGAAATGEAPVGLETTGKAPFNRTWTLMHVPCVTVPAGQGPTGLPVGLQIVGRRTSDALTLAAAQWIQDIIND